MELILTFYLAFNLDVAMLNFGPFGNFPNGDFEKCNQAGWVLKSVVLQVEEPDYFVGFSCRYNNDNETYVNPSEYGN